MKKIPTFLIAMVFIVYISLGLPDSIVGTAWPALRHSFGFSVDFIGILSGITLGFSIMSAVLYPRLSKIFNMSQFMIYSGLMVIAALLLMALSNHLLAMIAACLLLGFAQGSVDIVVNDYSAKHFSSSLLNILHAFYGVGVTVSSFIMTAAMNPGTYWRSGVWMLAGLQTVILGLIFMSRHRFEEVSEVEEAEAAAEAKLSWRHFIFPAFYFFYAVEQLIGRFYSSFAVEYLGSSLAFGGAVTSFYWGGLMVGRFVTGITARFLKDRTLIYLHTAIFLGGALLGFVLTPWAQYVSNMMLGFGFAPVYPTVMGQVYKVENPAVAKKIINLNVALIQVGMFLMPIGAGLLFDRLSFTYYPLLILLLNVICGALIFVIYQLKPKTPAVD